MEIGDKILVLKTSSAPEPTPTPTPDPTSTPPPQVDTFVDVLSTMKGKVASVEVSEGEDVEAGDLLFKITPDSAYEDSLEDAVNAIYNAKENEANEEAQEKINAINAEYEDYKNNSPKIKFSLVDIGRASQVKLKIRIEGQNGSYPWYNRWDYDRSLFDLRIKAYHLGTLENKSSWDYLYYWRFTDAGDDDEGPNRDTSTRRLRIKRKNIWSDTYLPGNDNEVGVWYKTVSSNYGNFYSFDSSLLSEEELDSLSDSPTNWKDECDGSYTAEDSSESGSILDFSASAFTSWNYNPVSRKFQYTPYSGSKVDWSDIAAANPKKFFLNSLTINESNQNIFHVYSVVDKCVIDASADVAMGFLVCRQLFIKSRTKPLKMIGTFVVDYINIDPTAINKGVDWYNVFHRTSIKHLQARKILPSFNYCSIDPLRPLWVPNPTAIEVLKQKECSPYAIAKLSDPFTWSTFNPKCGLESSKSKKTTCKPLDRIDKFQVTLMGDVYE